MEKILELLGIGKLDEAKQTDIKEKLQDLIDIKVTENVNSRLTEEKEMLVEHYESKFEEYKEDITSKFSAFVDEILETEMVIPEKVFQYAKKGEIYEEAIEMLKTKIAIDEGVLDEEAKELLTEAKEEIKSLRSEVNSLYNKNLQLGQDARELSAHLYLRKKCDGLLESQKVKVIPLLEGITDRKEIDRKFKLIVDSLKRVNEEEETTTSSCECPKCGKTSEVNGACSTAKCDECDVSLTEKKAKEEKVEEGKGNTEADPKTEDRLNEKVEPTPWENQMASWTKKLGK